MPAAVVEFEAAMVEFEAAALEPEAAVAGLERAAMHSVTTHRSTVHSTPIPGTSRPEWCTAGDSDN